MSLLLDITRACQMLQEHGHLIADISNWTDALSVFANIVYTRLGTYKNGFGFIDGVHSAVLLVQSTVSVSAIRVTNENLG